MTVKACENCDGWGKDCDTCRVGLYEEKPKEPAVKEESIGKLLIEAFSEGSLF